jgi:hypothetical protein
MKINDIQPEINPDYRHDHGAICVHLSPAVISDEYYQVVGCAYVTVLTFGTFIFVSRSARNRIGEHVLF